ncbi:MAG: helix-turn-helix transcriptional regulator [Caldilineaceae bacterium]|nr:helix-turn-helix transcriptional regulator [Caldilineaceae bacterium]
MNTLTTMATTISNRPQAATALSQSTPLKPTDDDLLRCPVEVAARIIGQKWTLQIVKTLLEEERVRFCELQDALGGVNPTTLSTRLKLLEENGIVCRTQISDLPPHVEYSLTEMGQQLDEVLRAVVGWSRRWLCPG